MDAAIASVASEGLAGNFTIHTFNRSEPLEGVVVVDVTAKPSSYTAWYEVASG